MRTDLIADTLLCLESLAFLLEETPSIFADSETIAYFRKEAFQKKIVPVEPIPLKIEQPIFPKPQVQIPSPAPLPRKEIEPAVPPVWQQEAKIAAEPTNFKWAFSLLPKLVPDLRIVESIPSDLPAKKMANLWKAKNQVAPISILSFQEEKEKKQFLTDITDAISVYFDAARLIDAGPIEKEKQWEAFLEDPELRLIIVCDYTLWQLKDLMRHYKEIVNPKARLLGKTPLFLLPDLSLYLKDPLLKKSLWRSLSAVMQNL